jgi:hypothetical protein
VRAYLKLDRWPATASFPIAARARISARGRALSLLLDVRAGGDHSQRTLVDADCDVLADGAALLIAIALAPAIEAQAPSPDADAHPEASTQAPATAPTPSPEPPAPAATQGAGAADRSRDHEPAPAASPALAPAHHEDARPSDRAIAPARHGGGTIASSSAQPDDGVRFAPELALGLGLLVYNDLASEGATLGVELAGELALRPWWVGLGLGLAPAQSEHPASYPAAKLSTSAVMVTLWPCYELALAPVALGLCAYGELGTVVARVSAIDEPQASRSTWVAGGGGLSLRYAVMRHLSAAFDLRVLRAADDLHFVIGGPAGDVELHHTGPVSLRFALRIAWIS